MKATAWRAKLTTFLETGSHHGPQGQDDRRDFVTVLISVVCKQSHAGDDLDTEFNSLMPDCFVVLYRSVNHVTSAVSSVSTGEFASPFRYCVNMVMQATESFC